MNYKVNFKNILKYSLMQKIFRLTKVILFCALFLSCRQSQPTTTQTSSNAKVEVLYFYSATRCPACTAIENSTKKVLDENYKTQTDNGIIHFTALSFDDKANKSLVEKYQVSYLTLLIIKPDGTKTDFTNTAFQYAESKPAKFEELLKAEINKCLE
jgi:hypothetical protein